MKIAFCLFNYFPFGGLQRDFLRIARVCLARQHEVHVYTMSWEGEREPGLHIHLVKATGLSNHARAASFAAQTNALVAADTFALVVGFNKMPGLDLYYAADVCYQARVKQQRGWWSLLSPRYRQYVKLESAVFQAKQDTAVMLISPNQQAEYTKYYQTEAARFHLLPPGIAKDRIAPANASVIRGAKRLQLGLTDNTFLLLSVGSGFHTKGVDRSLQAFASLPKLLREHCHYVVIGSDERAAYQAMAQKLQIASQVQFLGGRSDVADFYLAADLLLHPARHENTGTVLLEAMVSGLPVLTVDVCGYAHYVRDENAGVVLSSPFNQAAFNQAIEKMLLSRDRSEWQRQGLAFAKQADIYSMPEKAADLIERIGCQRDAISAS